MLFWRFEVEFCGKKKFFLTRNALSRCQAPFYRYFHVISTFLENFGRFLKRSRLNPHTGGAPGPPLVTHHPSKIYRKSMDTSSNFHPIIIHSSSNHHPITLQYSIDFRSIFDRFSIDFQPKYTSDTPQIHRCSIDFR